MKLFEIYKPNRILKSRIGRYIGIALLSIINYQLSIADVFAQFSASTSNSTVAVGDQFQVTFTLNGNGSNFHAPTFAEFNTLGGPSQSTNMSFVNGNVSQSISYTYVLQAVKEGTFTIGPASIESGGKKLQSNALTITVVKGSAPPPSSQR